jgi:antitoxin HigA-1
MTMSERLPSVHPGEILSEEFLKPMSITPYRLAKSIGVPQTRVAAILSGQRGITADTALRLGRFFGTSAELWLNLQATYELQEARRHGLDAELEKIRPYAAAGADRELAIA